jgi:hypothetical protein
LLGKFATSSLRFFLKVRVAGSRAYLIADMSPDVGLVIVDVSNPAAPMLLGSYISLTGHATDIQINGDRAYLTERLGALYILNVSNPAHISALGTYGSSYASFSAIQVVGSLAFIAAGEENAGDLIIVDVSSPATPKLLGERHLPSQALGVQVVGNLVYLSVGQDGLQVLRFPAPIRIFLPVARR